MKKAVAISLTILIISCSENFHSKIVPTPEILNTDNSFLSVMKTTKLITEKFDVLAETIDSAKKQKLVDLSKNFSNGSNYDELVSILGYSDTNEFEKVNKGFFEKLNKLNDKYLDLFKKNEGTYRDAVNLYNSKLFESEDYTNSYSAKRSPVCNGKLVVCTRSYNDCRTLAETGFAEGSWECAGGAIWWPGAWAACQATVFLMYSADMTDCNDDFLKCCP